MRMRALPRCALIAHERLITDESVSKYHAVNDPPVIPVTPVTPPGCAWTLRDSRSCQKLGTNQSSDLFIHCYQEAIIILLYRYTMTVNVDYSEPSSHCSHCIVTVV